MVAVGIAYGLGAALAQAVAYVFSRMFVARRPRGAVRLFALSHIIMGVISLALLGAFALLGASRPARIPPIASYILPLLCTAGTYMAAQLALFFILRSVDASRIAPLLALKIVALAVISITVLREHITMQQWGALAISVAAAFVLNRAGGRLGWGRFIAVMAICTSYSLSDLAIERLVEAMAPLPWTQAVGLSVCLTYIVCGLAGACLLPWAGKGAMADMRYAAAYSVAWLLAMVGLFGCIAAVGPVHANVILPIRGVISILLGVVLARLGYVHLEARHSGGVRIRQLAAAVMMCAAIALYSIDFGP